MPEHERLDRGAVAARGARARTPGRPGLLRPHAGVSPASPELLTASQVAAVQGSVGNTAFRKSLQAGTGAGVAVQRAFEPDPQKRLDAWIGKTDARDKDSDSGGMAKRSPALNALGRTVPDRMIEISEQSTDYKPDPTDSSGKPPLAGGAFRNLFGKDDAGSFAVMMENYRQSKDTVDPDTKEEVKAPAYTASDVFLNQWTAAHSVLDEDGLKGNKLNKKVKESLTAPKDAATGTPDKLPDQIYRQNISGAEAKKVLGGILGDRSRMTFTENSDDYKSVMATVNGKMTLNQVKTHNAVKGLPPEREQFISGGELTRDDNGNFHMRFDIGRRG
ncbi:hypothetical protein [Streptomyces sp. NPDC002913]